MQLSELDPGIFRRLTLHLVGEQQFKSDPAGSVLKTFDWLDRVVTDNTEPLAPVRNPLIGRLDVLAKVKGPEQIATAIGVSANTLRSWLYGVEPNSANLEKVKRYLETEALPTNVVGTKESGKAGELFHQPEFGQQQTSDEGQDD